MIRFAPRILIRPDGGFCWRCRIVGLRVPKGGGRVAVFEDGEPLPLADSVHQEIRTEGMGRYSVWKRAVFFSASDNSSPRENGRVYEVRVVRPEVDGLLFAVPESEDAFARRFEALAAARPAAPPGGKRVMLLISSLSPGGAERQFCYLAKGLAARGWDVHIGSLEGFEGNAGHYVPLLRESGVTLVDLSAPSREFDPGSLASRVPGALDLLQSLPDIFGADVWRVATHLAVARPDVLHCALDRPNRIGAVAGVATGVSRIVLSMRNVNPTNFPYLDVPWFRRWYRLAAGVPGLVMSANSSAGAGDYARWIGVPAASVRVVHNGLDSSAVRTASDGETAALRAELGIAPSAPVVAGVFRLSPEKRPVLWLDVVARLRSRFPALVALHAGDGPLADEVRRAARRRGLGDCVRWLGPRNDPAAVIRASDLLLLVSTFEGIPNVSLEAQWLERPVVCTAAGGSVDAVRDGDTGFVVAVPSAAMLADACGRILADPALRDRMGRSGRQLVLDEFSLDRMVEGSLALYR